MEYQQPARKQFRHVAFLVKTSFGLAFFASTYDRGGNVRLADQMWPGRTINTARIRIFVPLDKTQNRVKTKLLDKQIRYSRDVCLAPSQSFLFLYSIGWEG